MSELVRSLRQFTRARIGLASAGPSLGTAEALQLALDHARARDAVHAAFDADSLKAELAALGHRPCAVRSLATDRNAFLQRPDLGRRLHLEDAPVLATFAGASVCVLIADGLSPQAPSRHALPLLRELRTCHPQRWHDLPVAVAPQGRVALGDDVGAVLGAQVVLVLLGERPGLSSPDSLGAYLTYAPRTGRTDAERNCVSNIRPEGLGYAAAAHAIDWLVGQALARHLTGIELKDESGALPLRPEATAANIAP